MNRQYIYYVLGRVAEVEGVFMLLNAITALIYKEDVLLVYLLVGAISIGIGYLLSRKKPNTDTFYAKEGFIIVAISWIFMSLIGALPFFITREIPSFINALFETVSGFTTTGSSILTDIEALSKTSLMWRSFTHFLGGMGVLVFVLMLLPSSASGMHIMKAESPGPSVGKFVSKVKDTSVILYGIYTGLTILECIILVCMGMPVFDSMNIAFETAGTGGFAIYNAGMAQCSTPVLMVVATFMIIFGVNFNVYYLLLTRRAKEAFKCEEMHIYFGIVFASVVMIALNTNSIYQNLAYSFETAYFQVASIITTTGFASVDFDLWPSFSKTIMVCLMFCGACAGSTGGGIKVSRIVIMFKDMINSLRQVAHPRTVKPVRFEGKPVEKEILHSIRSYICIYAFIFIISILIISFDNFDFTTNFTAVAATLNNIGPGLNAVGPTCNFDGFSIISKLVLIFDMLAGRLELLPMLVLFSPFTYHNDSI